MTGPATPGWNIVDTTRQPVRIRGGDPLLIAPQPYGRPSNVLASRGEAPPPAGWLASSRPSLQGRALLIGRLLPLISVPHGLPRVQMLYAAKGRPSRPSSKLSWAERTSHRMRQVCVRLCPGHAETNVPLFYLSTCTPTPAVFPKASSSVFSFSCWVAASSVESLQRFLFLPVKPAWHCRESSCNISPNTLRHA